jgi:hypothetical protein
VKVFAKPAALLTEHKKSGAASLSARIAAVEQHPMDEHFVLMLNFKPIQAPT